MREAESERAEPRKHWLGSEFTPAVFKRAANPAVKRRVRECYHCGYPVQCTENHPHREFGVNLTRYESRGHCAGQGQVLLHEGEGARSSAPRETFHGSSPPLLN